MGWAAAWRRPFCLPGYAARLGPRTRPHLPGEGGRRPPGWGRIPILGGRGPGLQEELLATLSWKDTEDQRDKGDGCQHNPQVGHSQVVGGSGPVVGEGTVQADKEQPGSEGHAGSDVVQRLSVIHLGPERGADP